MEFLRINFERLCFFIILFFLACTVNLDSKVDIDLGAENEELELIIESLDGFDFGTVLVEEYSQVLSFNLSSVSNKTLYFNLDKIRENNSNKIFFSSNSFPGRNGTCTASLNINSPCKIELQIYSKEAGLIDENFKIYYSDKLINKEAIINLKANIIKDSSKDILSFTINSISGTIVNNNVYLVLESGTDLSSLSPTIVVSGVEIIPASNVVQDFTSPVIYTVYAQDASTKEYTIYVTKNNSTQKDIISFQIAGQSSQTIIDEDNLTINFNVLFNTDLKSTIATFVSTGIKVEVDGVVQTSGVSINNFTNPLTYIVTAEDETTKTYTVIVTIDEPTVAYKYNIKFNFFINHAIIFVPANLSYYKGYTNNIEVNVENAFWIGETELTSNVYYFIKSWAENNGYSFCNSGNGEDYLPISRISWRDSVVWTNALTEWYNLNFAKNLDAVYYTNESYTGLLKTATCANSIDYNLGSQDHPYIKENAKGFRLLNADEWELAARYKGNNSLHNAYEYPLGSNYFWTPGNYASGSISCYNCNSSIDTMNVAWFELNSDLEVKEVALKNPNLLGIYDMSGNVWEWLNDIAHDSKRLRAGGSNNNSAIVLRLANREGTDNPFYRHSSIGFRIARKY